MCNYLPCAFTVIYFFALELRRGIEHRCSGNRACVWFDLCQCPSFIHRAVQATVSRRLPYACHVFQPEFSRVQASLNMPRRSPPTSLRLVHGPVPPRSCDVLSFPHPILLNLPQSPQAHPPLGPASDFRAASNPRARPSPAPAVCARGPFARCPLRRPPRNPHPPQHLPAQLAFRGIALQPREHARTMGPLRVHFHPARPGESVDPSQARCASVEAVESLARLYSGLTRALF